MLSVINKAWSWIGLSATEVVAANAFGNVVVRATDGSYWRICPEELSCERVAADYSAYQRLMSDPEFQIDWQMDRLVAIAESKFGRNPPERCFCLKITAVFGGAYDIDNIGTITREEVVAAAGDIAEQIKDVPDGGEIILKVGPKPS
jgi:type VI secretion system (T6SS) immunity protein Tdi1